MEIRAKVLKDFLSLVTKLGNEPSLKLNADGLSTIVVDPAYVSIVQATIPKSEDCDPGRDEHEFTVDGKKMLKFVSCYKANDMLTVKIEDGRMTIHGGGMKFKLYLLNPESWPKVPNLESKLTAGGTISTKDIKAVLAAGLGTVTFRSDGERLYVEAQGDTDSIEASVEYKSEAGRGMYPEDYVANAMMGEEVLLKFGTDLPCFIYPALEGIEAKVLIAPRIESD